jgi:hypothetical protein
MENMARTGVTRSLFGALGQLDSLPALRLRLFEAIAFAIYSVPHALIRAEVDVRVGERPIALGHHRFEWLY